jgi:hypothetical protein
MAQKEDERLVEGGLIAFDDLCLLVVTFHTNCDEN